MKSKFQKTNTWFLTIKIRTFIVKYYGLLMLLNLYKYKSWCIWVYLELKVMSTGLLISYNWKY